MFWCELTFGLTSTTIRGSFHGELFDKLLGEANRNEFLALQWGKHAPAWTMKLVESSIALKMDRLPLLLHPETPIPNHNRHWSNSSPGYSVRASPSFPLTPDSSSTLAIIMKGSHLWIHYQVGTLSSLQHVIECQYPYATFLRTKVERQLNAATDLKHGRRWWVGPQSIDISCKGLSKALWDWFVISFFSSSDVN